MDDPSFEQPFRTDLDHYEGRASGIASVNGVPLEEASRDLAARHGFSSWQELRRHVEGMESGEVPPTPFVLAYRAIEDNDRDRLADLLDRFPDLVVQRGTPTPTAATTTAGPSSIRPAMGTTATSPG